MGRPACALLLLLLTAGGCSKQRVAAAVGFEGELTIQSELVGSPVTTTVLHVKGDKVQAQLPSATGDVVVVLADGKKDTRLFPSKHVYAQDDIVARPPTPTSSVTDTGRRELVAGTDCEVYEVRYTTVAGAFNEVCVAKTLIVASLALAPVADVLMLSDDFGVSGFPLRVLTRLPGGTITARMEVVKIDGSPQPDALFQIPAGFTALPKRTGIRPPPP